MILDLEMNQIQKKFKEERERCKDEIIEIGAVMLDENLTEISSFQTYVKPQYSSCIHSNITKLTGITTQMVEDAPFFAEAFNDFMLWCNAFEGDCQIQSWSESDYLQITREIALKQYSLSEQERKLMENWKDFQKEYMDTLGVEKCISLYHALEFAGEDFKGQQHDALFDARNTAELFVIVHDKVLFESKLHTVVEAFQPKHVESTLGEMFNFAELSAQLA